MIQSDPCIWNSCLWDASRSQGTSTVIPTGVSVSHMFGNVMAHIGMGQNLEPQHHVAWQVGPGQPRFSGFDPQPYVSAHCLAKLWGERHGTDF